MLAIVSIVSIIIIFYLLYQNYILKAKYENLHSYYQKKYYDDIKFLRQMNHVIRTPLNGILGFIELMQHKIYGDVPYGYKEYLQSCNDSGNELNKILQTFSLYCLEIEKSANVKYTADCDSYIVNPELLTQKGKN